MREKRNRAALLSALWLALTVCAFSGRAQDWAQVNIRHRQRIDLRELGYAGVNEIPANSSAITSLLTARDGLIYGATSGESAYLFLFDPALNKVRHLGRIAAEEGVHHALAEDREGNLYLGTGRDLFREIPLSEGGIGRGNEADKILWQDIRRHYSGYAGGHLYRYRPQQSNGRVRLPDMLCETEDLGIPVARNAIYALTSDAAGEEVYGLTYPDGHFFVYDLRRGRVRDLGEVDSQIVFRGPERHWRSLPRALICDPGTGRVFFSSTGGRLRYYCPKGKQMAEAQARIPGDDYHLQFYTDYAVAEMFAQAPSGLIYGGSSDGYLFALNPATLQVINHGKPRASRRIRCLAVGRDGRVYLMAGERSASRPCQFYCFDPVTGGFTDLGLLIADRSPHYYWRGQQFDAMTVGDDGTLYLGESERRSHLFLYMPPTP
ncbi:MAG: hypothetical protein RBT78_01310 [Kiritimatiellia bacterium]|jgi:outer membrane protein assembly factor BamB|nr:hypothetical protein [Kiritimatiellia bacterium]